MLLSLDLVDSLPSTICPSFDHNHTLRRWTLFLESFFLRCDVSFVDIWKAYECLAPLRYLSLSPSLTLFHQNTFTLVNIDLKTHYNNQVSFAFFFSSRLFDVRSIHTHTGVRCLCAAIMKKGKISFAARVHVVCASAIWCEEERTKWIIEE